MRLDGILFILLSWAVILTLFAYSMFRTLSGKHRDQLDKEAISQNEERNNP